MGRYGSVWTIAQWMTCQGLMLAQELLADSLVSRGWGSNSLLHSVQVVLICHTSLWVGQAPATFQRLMYLRSACWWHCRRTGSTGPSTVTEQYKLRLSVWGQSGVSRTDSLTQLFLHYRLRSRKSLFCNIRIFDLDVRSFYFLIPVWVCVRPEWTTFLFKCWTDTKIITKMNGWQEQGVAR